MRTNGTREDCLIVIADNRPMYRAGIKSFLQKIVPTCRFSEHYLFNDLTVDSAAGDTIYFLIRVGSMPNKSVIENIRKLKSKHKTCKIILYDYQQPVKNIVGFFKEKIDAYLADDFGEEELKECFSSLMKNQIYLNMQIAVEILIRTPKIRSRENLKLTPTEIKVANFLVSGLSPSLIAKEMDRKISTINTIKTNIFRKTQVNSVIDLEGVIETMPRAM